LEQKHANRCACTVDDLPLLFRERTFLPDAERTKAGQCGLVAVLPQPVEDSRNYLSKLGVETTGVVQSSLSSIGVSGTPTLLLVDNTGSVVGLWVGKLSESDAARVIEQIRE